MAQGRHGQERQIVFLSSFTGKSVSESVSERDEKLVRNLQLEAGLEARNGWAGGLETCKETYSWRLGWRLVMGGLEAQKLVKKLIAGGMSSENVK